MQWSSATEFFAMGGYGLYIWGAYGMTALVIALELIALLTRRRAARAPDPR
jgi:heme exporter protein D